MDKLSPKKDLHVNNPARPGRLPQKPISGGLDKRNESFNMFAQQEEFKPVKRRKERPRVVENDIDFESDALPDLDQL